MAIAKFAWRVSWGKKRRYEDRFKTKEQALNAAKKLKMRRDKHGREIYHNVRVGRVGNY